MEHKATQFELFAKKPAGAGFLQSPTWIAFQEAFGRRTFNFTLEGIYVGLIEHELPLAGRYLYVPRGPLMSTDLLGNPFKNQAQIANIIREMIQLAKRENAGWIRFEPASKEVLGAISNAARYNKIVKAPYDVQPREIFAMDITKSEDVLLEEMKSKTRYNIRLAQKKGVKIFSVDNAHPEKEKYLKIFWELTKEMASRQGIVPHPQDYYRKMFEIFPNEMLKLYVAQFEDEVVGMNLVLFFEQEATYLHGASSDKHRSAMAPYLLQWEAIKDAKKQGCYSYDFGGIKTSKPGSWAGITVFKVGFSPQTKPVEYQGSYDLIVNKAQYSLYRGLQKAKMVLHRIRR